MSIDNIRTPEHYSFKATASKDFKWLDYVINLDVGGELYSTKLTQNYTEGNARIIKYKYTYNGISHTQTITQDIRRNQSSPPLTQVLPLNVDYGSIVSIDVTYLYEDQYSEVIEFPLCTNRNIKVLHERENIYANSRGTFLVFSTPTSGIVKNIILTYTDEFTECEETINVEYPHYFVIRCVKPNTLVKWMAVADSHCSLNSDSISGEFIASSNQEKKTINISGSRNYPTTGLVNTINLSPISISTSYLGEIRITTNSTTSASANVKIDICDSEGVIKKSTNVNYTIPTGYYAFKIIPGEETSLTKSPTITSGIWRVTLSAKGMSATTSGTFNQATLLNPIAGSITTNSWT